MFKRNKKESKISRGIFITKTKCEIFSRVVGYIRPIEQWNDSKKAEFHDRKKFDDSIKENQTKLKG